MTDRLSTNFPVDVLKSLETGIWTAIRGPDASLSNLDVAAAIRRIAQMMSAQGVGPGSTVIISVTSQVTSLYGALAAALLGAAFVPYSSFLPFREIRASHTLHQGPLPAGVFLPHAIDLDAARTQEGGGRAAAGLGGYAEPDAIAAYVNSSGTTGTPKYIARRVADISVERTLRRLGTAEAVGTLFPLISSRGFVHAVACLAGRKTLVLLATSPKQGVGPLAHYAGRGLDVVVGSPAQANLLCRGVPPLTRRVGSLQVGGSLVTREDVDRWLDHFESVHVSYGSRELGGIARAVVTERAPGTPFDYEIEADAQVEIVSDAGMVLPRGETGRIRIRAGARWRGYLNFDAGAAGIVDSGWFYPGDVGQITPTGRLVIGGRIADIVNVGGVKLHLGDIDQVLRKLPGLVEGAAFAVRRPEGERIGLAVVLEGGPRRLAEPERHRILAAAESVLRAPGLLAGIGVLDTLPINDMGKVDRQALARRAGGHSDAASSSGTPP